MRAGSASLSKPFRQVMGSKQTSELPLPYNLAPVQQLPPRRRVLPLSFITPNKVRCRPGADGSHRLCVASQKQTASSRLFTSDEGRSRHQRPLLHSHCASYQQEQPPPLARPADMAPPNQRGIFVTAFDSDKVKGFIITTWSCRRQMCRS